MMSCALCSKWQHILCHNKRDQAAGHPSQNWDSVEFICQRCRTVPDALQPSGSSLRGLPAEESSRPNGVGQSSNVQGHVLSSTSSSTSKVHDPPLASTPRQMISFNHYQPAGYGFSSSAPRAYKADSHSVYENQQPGAAAASYKPQVLFIILNSNRR